MKVKVDDEGYGSESKCQCEYLVSISSIWSGVESELGLGLKFWGDGRLDQHVLVSRLCSELCLDSRSSLGFVLGQGQHLVSMPRLQSGSVSVSVSS